ncbi:MAG TPA: prolyl oligopeptidase family serine peptidase, partial [Lacunisphaera sp.]
DPRFRMLKISPDGKTIALVSVRDYVEVVTTIDLATMTSAPLGIIDKMQVADFWWKGSDRVVFLLSNGWNARFSMVDVKTKKQPWGIVTKFRAVVNPLANDADHMLVADEMGHLKKIDLRTGKSEIYEKHQERTFRWLTDREGHALAAQGRLNEDWFMVTKNPDGSWSRTGLGNRDRPDFWPIAVYSDQRSLLGWDNASANTARVVVRDPATGHDELLFYSEEADPDYNVYWGDDYTHLRGVSYDTDRIHTVYIDPQDAAIAAQIDKTLPGTTNDIISTSADETKLIIKSYSVSQPDTYFLFDRTAKRISLLGKTRPDLDPKQMGTKHYFHFTARDGLAMSATLLLPPATTVPPPVLVYTGGSLSERISSVYQPYLQLFASRGYAILQVNHRGVDGFGQKHALAGTGEIDGKMCDDLADGLAFAIKQGWVDGKHTGMFTQGVGGILGVFTLARHPELFTAWVNFDTPMYTGYLDLENFVFGLHEKSGYELPLSTELKVKAYARTLDPAGSLKDIKVPSFHYFSSINSRDDREKAAKVLRNAGLPVVALVPPTRYSVPEYAEARKQDIEEQERLYGEALKFLETYLPKPISPASSPGSGK